MGAIDIAVRNGGGLKTAATKPGLEFLGGLLFRTQTARS
jgi:hypothetical protein